MESKKVVVIVDYDLGNLYSVNQSCRKIGLNSKISSNLDEIQSADALILPGVGAFKDAIQRLNDLGIAEKLKQFANSGKPFLGICLGMQLMMSISEEFGIHEGLNLVSGKVKRFPFDVNLEFKVPQIQWNQININYKEVGKNYLFKGLENNSYMYFLHSYYVEPTDLSIITSTTNYCDINYCCSFQQNNLFATQFHPEKSTKQGLQIFNNFKNIINHEL